MLNMTLCLSENHLSDAELSPSFLLIWFFSLTEMIHTCLDEGFSESPKHPESACCMKCILSLMKRTNAKQTSSPKLTATPSSPCQCILAFSLHSQWYLYTSSEHVPCLLRYKDRKFFPVSLSNNTTCRDRDCLITVSLAIRKYHISPTKKTNLWQVV